LRKGSNNTYSTTFGNGYGDHTIIRGTRWTLYSPGGRLAAMVAPAAIISGTATTASPGGSLLHQADQAD
jgi:hypothetical protein